MLILQVRSTRFRSDIGAAGCVTHPAVPHLHAHGPKICRRRVFVVDCPKFVPLGVVSVGLPVSKGF